MYAQMLVFDGPRDAAQIAASDRASRDRIGPAIAADEQLAQSGVTAYLLRQPDGAEVMLAVAEREADLRRMTEVAMGTSLLPDEDPALLPGPDRVEQYEVIEIFATGSK